MTEIIIKLSLINNDRKKERERERERNSDAYDDRVDK